MTGCRNILYKKVIVIYTTEKETKKLSQPGPHIHYLSIPLCIHEIFSKLFSTERIKLMLRVKENKLINIYQLAKELERPYEAVYRDIRLLEGYNLIKIKTKDKKKIPSLSVKELALV